jgi:hypothetical protein
MKTIRGELRLGIWLPCLLLNFQIVRVVRAGGKYSVYWKAKKYYRKYFSKESNSSQIYRRCC